MTGLVFLAAAAGGSAVALALIVRAIRRRDLVEPVLACDVCDGLVRADEAHRPHEPDCTGEPCRCDRLTCPTCCDDVACRAMAAIASSTSRTKET